MYVEKIENINTKFFSIEDQKESFRKEISELYFFLHILFNHFKLFPSQKHEKVAVCSQKKTYISEIL